MANDTSISERELEILRLVATGASNQQIAQALSISINTVKVHLRNIFSKIGVVSRTEATIYAISNGLVAVDSGAGQAPAEETAAGEVAPADPAPPRLDVPAAPADPAPIAPASPARAPRWALPAGLAALVALAALAILVVRGMSPAGQAATTTAAPAPAPTAVSAASQWRALAAIPSPRDGFALVAYDQEQKLYVIGGRDGATTSAATDRFDPASNLWVSLADKPIAISDAHAISLRGKIYVPGGIDAAGTVRDTLEFYDPREQRWGQAKRLPAPRSRYALVAWEGRLYLIGGWDGVELHRDVFVYDPLTDTWSDGPALAAPLQGAGAAVVSGRIYVIGGSGADGPLREGARLDPSADDPRWEAIAPLPAPIAAPSVAVPVSALLVFDTERHQGLQYDQNADAWTYFAVAEDALLSPDAALLGNSIYFVAGAQAASPGAVSAFQAIYSVFVPGASGRLPAP